MKPTFTIPGPGLPMVLVLFLLCWFILLGLETRAAAQTPITGPLTASRNPDYFQDAGGNPLILCGSQTWNTLQDWGTGGSAQPLDFDAFVNFLKAHGHNFTLLWRTELPKFSNLPVTATNPPDFTVSPHPWRRTGPGLATDGGLKFDLTRFDSDYFERLRARVAALNRGGIYAGVYLFTGEFLLRFRSPTDGYPFSGPNNVNGVDDGYFGMWNDPPQKNRNYAWENFAAGNQVLFMDPYLVYYPRENRNLCLSPRHGIGLRPDPRWDSFRDNLGYLLRYSRKLKLAQVTSRSSLCSTKYCLAQTPAAGAEYLAYAPDGGGFTMDLSAMPSTRKLAVEWFNPASGETITESPIPAGSPARSFRPPFSGDAVLYLVDTEGHK